MEQPTDRTQPTYEKISVLEEGVTCPCNGESGLHDILVRRVSEESEDVVFVHSNWINSSKSYESWKSALPIQLGILEGLAVDYEGAIYLEARHVIRAMQSHKDTRKLRALAGLLDAAATQVFAKDVFLGRNASA